MTNNQSRGKKTARRRRSNKAAMAREVARVRAERANRPALPDDIAAVIARYTSPALTLPQLAAVRPFLRDVFTASTLRGRESVRKHCTHVAALAGYATGRGVPLEVGTVFTTAMIDEYVRVGMAGASDALRAERRRRLLALAAAVNPGPTAPAKLAPIGHRAIKPPYTPAELATIVRVSGVQPTQVKRRALSIVVGLGAGAGCDSVDLRGMRVEHVEDLGDDGLLAHVQSPRPRVVPVRASLEDLVRAGVAGRRGSELLIGVKEDRRNTAARAVEAAALYKVPHIEPARLRATWLADVMTDTIPIGVLLRAAGLKSARTLADLLPHLGPWLEHKNLPADTEAILRGGAR